MVKTLEDISFLPVTVNKLQLPFSSAAQEYGSVQQCQQINNENVVVNKIYDINNKLMQQFRFPHIEKHDDGQYLQKCVIDPDNLLSQEFRQCFVRILGQFADIITERPGCYNGSFGQVSCTVNMIDEPPPSIKPHLPNYSVEKLQIIAAIRDDMEKWGVLVKPEQLGVVPTYVHPCIPKEDGKFRLVTDFRSIQSFIKPLPTVMPTVSEAMSHLSSADWHIELDFSNYYWQNA